MTDPTEATPLEPICTPEQFSTLLDLVDKMDRMTDEARNEQFPHWTDLITFASYEAKRFGYQFLANASEHHRARLAGPTTTPAELRALLDVWMTTDPADRYPGIQHGPLTLFVEREAVAHGYDHAVAAYHEHRPEPRTRVLVHRPLDGTMETAP